jgi:iron uptake system component EfeO
VSRASWLVILALACGEPAPPEPALSPSDRAVIEVKRYVDTHVSALASASRDLCAAAPAPDADGWSLAHDRAAVEAMRGHWRRARVEYERIEGAIAVLFPELDQDVDGRYEHEAELRRDEAPFDGRGFIGMHAIERILFSSDTSAPVRAFEEALPGYVAPRTPASEEEARAFTEGLCAQLVRDVGTMERQLAPLALDPPTAWRGIQGSIEEQSEKVLLAATGQDESRYSENTLADMRANLEGGRAVLAAYEPMLAPEARAEIDRRMDELERAYAAIGGDALPEVPPGFDPDSPSEAHLATDYGRLFTLLASASDPQVEGSLAQALRRAGDAMGIPPLAR